MTTSPSDPATRDRVTAPRIDGWPAGELSANTRSAYLRDLDVFERWCRESDTTTLTADTAALMAFQADRIAHGDRGSTIRRRWSALASYYRFAVEHELRIGNPVLGVVRPTASPDDPSPTVRLAVETVERCRTVAASLDPRLEALVALVVVDGLKVVEALALDVTDVSGRSPSTSITITRRGESRRVVLEPDSALAVRRSIGGRRSGPVFLSRRPSRSDDDRRLTRFGADHLLRRLRADESSEQVTASALRRFHIENRPERGDALDDVRDRAGLADVQSTTVSSAAAHR